MARALEGRANSEWLLNRWTAQGELQKDCVAVDDGRWQPANGVWPLAIVLGATEDVEGTPATFTAELLVCNRRRRPADSDNAWPSIETFREMRVYTVTQPFYWIKLRVTEVTGGAINANYQGAGPVG